jgi:hypothetical protein
VHAGLAAALALHASWGRRRCSPAAAPGGGVRGGAARRLRERAIAPRVLRPAAGPATSRRPRIRSIGAVHVHFPALDPYPAYAALDARGIHLKCIKGTRPGGRARGAARVSAVL